LTAGDGSSGPSTTYPGQLATALPDYDIVNGGLSGDTIANMVSTGTTTVDRPSFGPDRSLNILVLWAGTNDLFAGGTAIDAYANITTFVGDRRTYGWDKIILCTPIVRSAPAPFETERISLRSLILANVGTLADAVVDLDVAGLTDYTNLVTFNPDQTHLTDVGYGLVKDEVYDAVLSVIS